MMPDVVPSYIHRCVNCHGVNWGPVAPPLRERLDNGEFVITEVWGCHDCQEPWVPDSVND